MSGRHDIYWPVFLVVSAVSFAAVWRFAPHVPVSSGFRSSCVEFRHRAMQLVRLEAPANAVVADTPQDDASGEMTAPLAEYPKTEAIAKTGRDEARPSHGCADAAQHECPGKDGLRPVRDHGGFATASTAAQPAAGSPQPRISEKAGNGGALETTRPVKTNAGGALATTRPAKAEAGDAPATTRPASEVADEGDVKSKRDAIRNRMEERRLEILRRNVAQSPDGEKALAALKKFKKYGTEVEELKRRYGETDSRVVNRRGELLRLKNEVRRTMELYRKWKERNPKKVIAPEDDPEYRRLAAELQLLGD